VSCDLHVIIYYQVHLLVKPLNIRKCTSQYGVCVFVCLCVSFLTNNSGVYCVVGPAVVDVSKNHTAFIVKGQVDQELFNDTPTKTSRLAAVCFKY